MGLLGEEIITDTDFCTLANRWGVRSDVMQRIRRAAVQFEFETGRRVWIISGFRTAAEQQVLEESGRPTAPDRLSTHRSCPATGVNIFVGPFPDFNVKLAWGRIVVFNGLRWGGGSPVDPETGIPSDWAHVDAGPRVLVGATP